MTVKIVLRQYCAVSPEKENLFLQANVKFRPPHFVKLILETSERELMIH